MAAAVPLAESDPVASTLRPIGPAATDKLPPTVKLPDAMNDFTAELELDGRGRGREEG